MTRRAQVYNGQSSSYLCAGKQQEFLVLLIAGASWHSEHSVVGQYEQGSWGLETGLLKVLVISKGQSLVPAPSPGG